MDLTMRYAIIFRRYGFDEDSVKSDLETIFGVKVVDILDEIVGEGDDEEPAKVFVIESSLGQFAWVKVALHCQSDPNNKYLLWPMAA